MSMQHPLPVRRNLFWELAARREIALAVVITLIVFGVLLRNSDFVKQDTLGGIIVNCVQPAIIACGVMLVIVTGEIDISVGASLGFLTAVMGILMSKQQYPVWADWVSHGFKASESVAARAPFSVPAAIAITMGLGALIGVANGVLVMMVRVPSIIVTLGMLTVLKGLTHIMMKGGTSRMCRSRFIRSEWGVGGGGEFFGGRYSVWIATLLVILPTWGMIRYTPMGRRIYAVGSNKQAALLAGISETWVKIFAFTLTGFLVAVAAVVTQVAVFDNGTGEGMELLVVTCVVVGGVSISGGVGSVIGVVLGVVLLMMQKTVLIFLKLSPNASNWDKAIQGALILIAVLVDHLASRRAKVGGGHLRDL